MARMGNLKLRLPGVPLWPLPLLCAVLPFVITHLAWWLSAHQGLIPNCNPYVDGCVSISRAARHGLSNHLFRMVMLPAAMLQVLFWLATALWLRRIGAGPARLVPWLGLVAGAFLVLYATFLGSEGEIYQVLRRYGITVYFAATCLALLALLRALSRQSPREDAYRRLLLVALGFMAIGLASVAVSYTVGDGIRRDQWENILEWHLGLWLTALFAVLAWRWRRERLRVDLLQ